MWFDTECPYRLFSWKKCTLDGQNRQSPIASERGQLSQAIPQFHVERMLNEWKPIARFESRHNERRAWED